MLKTVSSITNAIGALNYKGTWNASTNTPTLASGVGTKGDYYVVSVAGSTTLDGISNWGIGDWAVYNGSVWQRVEGGADLNGVNLSVSGTTTLSGLTASTALALNASKEVVSVTNTGTGDNVLATSPTMTTPRVVTSINDTNGNELFGITATASAVNEVTVANAATGNNPTISATGSDTNIGITLTPKGTGNAVLTTGNLVVANGNGIDFSATSGTGTSELLADYEEGTWTPTFVSTTGSNPTVTYGNQYGYYVKVGRMVHINLYLTASVITGGTGWLTVGGLPFVTDSSTASYSGVAVAGVDNIPMAGSETQYGLRVSPSGSTMLFLLLKANTASAIVDLTGVSQGGVAAGGTYISAS